VKSIDTVLDPMTRSVKVRAEIANPDGFLKPEMFVNVTIYIPLGRKLAIPEDAVLDTGERKLVFLSLGEGKFAPREVKLGYSAEGYYEITSGLREGDKVVTSANFLIDSESKLKSAISGMGEHKH
jgi:Cu(I)/Ag(I) efflux system membrane fusion protein